MSGTPREPEPATTPPVVPDGATVPPEQGVLVPTEPRTVVPGYEVLGELGRGGMGVVYKARQIGLNRIVALKMILAGGEAGADELARFRREAEALARLDHPNVLNIYEVGEYHGTPFFSLEYCEGGSLAHVFRGRSQSPRRAAELTATLARAVHAAHAVGIVHRDLKPANVLFAENETAKIADFGLARKLDGGTDLTRSGAIMGTPSYMAPEQAQGDGKHAGPACDVYALGAILYECLTGRPPFRAATAFDTILQVLSDPPLPPSRIRAGVPADLEAICLRCLEKAPRRRYASALALAEDLDRFLAGGHARRRKRRRIPFLAPAGAFLLAAAAFLVYNLTPARRPRAVFPASEVTCLSPGGEVLLVAGPEGGAIHDTRSAERLAEFSTRAGFTAAAFSSDGGLAALGAKDGTVDLWDLVTGTARPAFRASVGAVGSLAFSPDGEGLAAAGADGGAAWWDLKASRAAKPIAGVGVLAPDGRTFAEPTPTGLRLWDTARSEVRVILPVPKQDQLRLIFTPDGSTLLTMTPDRDARLWDVRGGAERGPLRGRVGTAGAVFFSPDSRLLFTDFGRERHLVWSATTGEPEASPSNPPVEYADYITFTPGGESLVAYDSSAFIGNRRQRPAAHTLFLLERATGKRQRRVFFSEIVPGGVEFLAQSKEGWTLVTRDWPGEAGNPDPPLLRVWDREEFWVGRAWLSKVWWLGALSLLVGAALLAVEVQRQTSPAEMGQPTRWGPPPRALAFSRDGQTLAVGGNDGSVRLWDIVEEQSRVLVSESISLKAPPPLPKGMIETPGKRMPIVAMAFVSNGGQELLAVVDVAGVLRLWDPVTPAEPIPLLLIGHRVNAAAFSADGGTLAVATGGWPLRVWEPHWTRFVGQVCRYLRIPGPNLTVRLWDLSTLREMTSRQTDGHYVWDMAFAPSGDVFTAATDVGARRFVACDHRTTLTEEPIERTPRDIVWIDCDGVAHLGEQGREQGDLLIDRPPTVTVLPPSSALKRDFSAILATAVSSDGKTLALANRAGGVGWCDIAEVRRASPTCL